MKQGCIQGCKHGIERTGIERTGIERTGTEPKSPQLKRII